MPTGWLGDNEANAINTTALEDTQTLLKDLADCGGIGASLGSSGLGKSYALNYWLESAKIRAWSIEPYEATTPRRLIADLLKGSSGTEDEPVGTQYTLTGRLIEELAGERALVAIDEAQWLTPRSLKALRGLWQHPRANLAILLAAGPELEPMLVDEPMLQRRLTGVVRFEPFSEQDVLEILPGYHSIYDRADPALLLSINRRYP